MSEIRDHWENIGKDSSNILEFQNIFDATESVESSISMGFVDFATRIFVPAFYPAVGNPVDKTCLEIGFGGGRIINAASRFFGKTYGIDIMSDKSMLKVESFLDDNGAKNFTLLSRDNEGLIPDSSIDFAFSFIVFQHFDSIDEVHYYLNILRRVLKDNAIGILYFGLNLKDDKDFFVKEKPIFTYNHHDSTLFLSQKYGQEIVSEYFDVASCGRIPKKPWAGQDNLSRQFFVAFTNSK
jgi:ubiquinone/menaquinone biosynthesis C-methylase UbiE